MTHSVYPRITVLVHSFERPRMLREALASIVAGRPHEIIVCDDGSTFDIVTLCADFGAMLVTRPPLTVEERMVATRQGGLLNQAMALATGDVLTSLCDDDLHHEGWYDALRRAWQERPTLRLARGDWLVFEDGQVPTRDDPESPMCPQRRMTAGNFAWSRRMVERGARWPEDRANCHDDGFLWSLKRAGADVFNAPTVGFAGWRRNHAKVLTNFSDGRNNTEGLRAVLAGGSLE